MVAVVAALSAADRVRSALNSSSASHSTKFSIKSSGIEPFFPVSTAEMYATEQPNAFA